MVSDIKYRHNFKSDKCYLHMLNNKMSLYKRKVGNKHTNRQLRL